MKIPVLARDLQRDDVVGGGDVVVSSVIVFPRYVSVVVRCSNGEPILRSWDNDQPPLDVTRPAVRVA